jgi:hypothetical protein
MLLRFSSSKSFIMLIFLFTGFAIIGSGCQSPPTVIPEKSELSSVNENAAHQTAVMGKSVSSYIIVRSIAELAIHADLIVIGQVERIDRVVNMARDINDISKPELRLLVLGQMYQMKVDTLLKGEDPGSTLSFVQQEGFLHKPQMGEEPSPEDVKLARENSDHTPFDPNQRYLLFLQSVEGLNHFVPLGLEPWRFDATDGNNVYPESPALVDIRPTPLTVIIEQIQAVPTPEPTVISPLPTPLPIDTVVPAEQSAP